MDVVAATPEDSAGFLSLASEVEAWFGPMVNDAGFHAVLEKNIRRGTALVVRAANSTGLLGGLLTGGQPSTPRLTWLVVAEAARGRGIGRSLVNHAISSYVQRPCRVDVITFGKDHPAVTGGGGSRAFYERLGFKPGEQAPNGPEGGSRQWYHLTLTE